jgi:NADH dehydrogenase
VNKTNKIAITGASGFVGRNVGQFLARNGFDVIGIVRKGKKRTIDFGQAVLSEDLTEKDLVSSVRGSIALMHFIGTGKQIADSDYETVNVGLTKNVVRLCKQANIKKILYNSGLGVDQKSTLGYFISKFKAEQAIMESGLDYTIFRPSYIVGNNDPLSRMLINQMKNNLITIPGSGRYRLQPILVSDVARIVTKAIHGKQFSRNVIDLVGPQIVSYNRFVRDLIGKKRIRIRNVDFEKAYHDALRGKNPHYGTDDLSLLVGDYIGNHKRLAKISGIVFTKYEKMLEACRLS